MFQGSVGELESRSPTPTPPVLEPEVTLPRPAAENTDAGTEADQGHNETSEQVEEEEAVKYIPRLLDAAGNVTPRSRDQNLEPAEWSVQNVTSFLEVRHPSCHDDRTVISCVQVNECSNLVHNFTEKGVDGIKFLTLTKQEMMSIVNNKMGPCLKIEHLQKLLKVLFDGSFQLFYLDMIFRTAFLQPKPDSFCRFKRNRYLVEVKRVPGSC